MKKLILIALVCSAAMFASAQSYFGVKPIVNEPNCYGASTGSIQLSLVGGTGPFDYAWASASGSLPNSNTVTNLAAGSYSVTVTDANNLTTSYVIVIAQPFQINPTAQYNVGSHGQANGYINLSVDGGTPSYTYSWSDGETTADIANLPAGNYVCTITDAEGCTATVSQTITDAPLIHGVAYSGQNDPRSLSTSSNTAPEATTAPGFKGAELKSTDVQVYPNPASSAFTLKTGEVNNAQISLIDINGQTVSTVKAESNETNLSVSGLTNGNYIIEIITESGSVVNKTVTVAK